MNDKIKLLAEQAGITFKPFIVDEEEYDFDVVYMDDSDVLEDFVRLVVQECLDKIETYRISCGNSPAGEMACEWTYNALKSIRDDIKETFGVE